MTVNTYDELQTTVLTTAAASVTFNLSSITGYTDLVLVTSLKITTGGATNDRLQFNGDAGGNYSNTVLYGTGSTAGSYRSSSATIGSIMDDVTSTEFTVNVHHIMNYANTTTHKTTVGRSSPTGSAVQANVGVWRNTAAITSVTVISGASTFVAGSTFSLYGIKAWVNETTPKATGGYVSQDSTYWYHAFPFSSTFTPNQSLTADILCVAGGGGGGYFEGGGGAGGLLTFTSQSLTATNYAITVGAGGAGDSSIAGSGSNGTNSQFGALTAAVGGGGGGSFENNGNNDGASGGSGGGGGGGDNAGILGTGGGFTSGQGYAGGNGSLRSTYHAGGGGGGAGAAGQSAANADTPGNGGIGATSALINAIGAATTLGQYSAGNYYFAGGGGGGANNTIALTLNNGGLGGGGNGGYGPTNAQGTNGLVSTGGGGGGNANNNSQPGPYGGSGIVVVRYAK
jgi:hypothetical protein